MDTTSSNMSSSPASTPGSSLSVQAYTSQFIKEGLKIKMKQRIGKAPNLEYIKCIKKRKKYTILSGAISHDILMKFSGGSINLCSILLCKHDGVNIMYIRLLITLAPEIVLTSCTFQNSKNIQKHIVTLKY